MLRVRVFLTGTAKFSLLLSVFHLPFLQVVLWPLFLAVKGLCSATGCTVGNTTLGDGCFMSLSMPYFVGPK